MRSGLLTLVGAALGLYAVCVVLLYLFQRQLLYFPAQALPSPAASGIPEMTSVWLETDDGLRLTAWFAPAEADKPTFVHFHGNGGNISGRGGRARPYLDQGYGVLLAEYRGYGGNPGRPTEAGLYADAMAAFRFIEKTGIDHRSVFIYGESLGTAVAVYAAAELAQAGTPVAGVILEAPMSSITDVAAYHYPLVPVRPLLKDRFEAITRVEHISAPLLVVHGSADQVVPLRFGEALYAMAQEPKEALWIDAAGHDNLAQFGLHQAVLQFIDGHAKEGSGVGE